MLTPRGTPLSPPDLRLARQLEVRLLRSGHGGSWRAEMRSPVDGGRMCFLSLDSLLAWVAALERQDPGPPPEPGAAPGEAA